MPFYTYERVDLDPTDRRNRKVNRNNMGFCGPGIRIRCSEIRKC